MNNRPAWTLSEAAERTKASRSTLRRYQEAGKFPDAYKDSRNQWRFPVDNIIAAGIELVRVAETSPSEQAQPQNDSAQAAPAGTPQVDNELVEKLRRMEIDLAVERQKNEGLQQLVDATRQGQSDLRRALLVLEAPKPAPTPQPVSEPESKVFALGTGRDDEAQPQQQDSNTTQQPRKGWFARLIGE